MMQFGNNNFNGAKMAIVPKLMLAVILLVFVLSQSFTIIDTGEQGVVLRLGEMNRTMREGLNFKIPMIENVVVMSVRDETYRTKLAVSSSDVQTISVEETLIYALEPEMAGQIYRKYGRNIINTLVVPTLAEVTNAVIAKYPIEEFVEKRTEIAEKINKKFVDKVQGNGLVVKSLLITNHDLSKKYEQAIEDKKVAEQGALKAKYDLERITLEAQAQMKKRASLDPLVLQERAIDKWDGKLPQYWSGSSLPFIIQK